MTPVRVPTTTLLARCEPSRRCGAACICKRFAVPARKPELRTVVDGYVVRRIGQPCPLFVHVSCEDAS